ncbi:MAG TPA: FecR family protein [Nitrospira sp.]|nr:FecR family protein [Nitrospira sp.]
MRPRTIGLLCISMLSLCPLGAWAEDPDTVGVVLAVQGTAVMQPATMSSPVKVRPFDEVGPLSILETQPGSRCKVLYQDDSMVTLGEDSRLEITEQRFEPGGDRAFVAHLARGAVRALVARHFEGDNSTFEVHASTSVATARGTYLVLWLGGPSAAGGTRKGNRRGTENDLEGVSGVANIGRDGNVAFTSGGATVLVLPGQFSLAYPGAAPTMPAPLASAGGQIAAAIAGTELKDSPRQESPKEALAAAGIGAAGVTAPLAGPAVARAGSLGGLTPSTSYMLPDWPFPITPATPPAVVSGAAPGSVNPAAPGNSTINLNIRLP